MWEAKSCKAYIAAETEQELATPPHAVTIYIDGCCDGNGAKGTWSAAGFGATVKFDDHTTTAELYGADR